MAFLRLPMPRPSTSLISASVKEMDGWHKAGQFPQHRHSRSLDGRKHPRCCISRNDRPRPATGSKTSRGLKMSAVQSHIPTEVYLDFLGRTIPVRWDYHAILMVSIWFVLIPICILVIRFGKPKPTLTGLHRKVSIWHAEWWWFSVHKYGLIFAIGMALAGAVVAILVSC